MKRRPAPVLAPYGKRMIFVEIGFHTDGIVRRKGYVIPKRAWTNGAVYIRANPVHGIKAKSPQRFNSLLALTSAIERALTASGITLVAYKTHTIAVKP